MAFEGKLFLNDDKKGLPIISMDFQFQQDIDYYGKPCSNPNGGVVVVTIESKTNNSDLAKWMTSPTSTKNVLISFYDYSEAGKSRKIALTDAYCVGYREHFEAYGSCPMQTTLTLSSLNMSVDDTKAKTELDGKEKTK